MYLIGNVIHIHQDKLVENLIILPAMVLFAVLAVATVTLTLLVMAALALGLMLYLIDD